MLDNIERYITKMQQKQSRDSHCRAQCGLLAEEYTLCY